jgi:hypothetical protein
MSVTLLALQPPQQYPYYHQRKRARSCAQSLSLQPPAASISESERETWSPRTRRSTLSITRCIHRPPVTSVPSTSSNTVQLSGSPFAHLPNELVLFIFRLASASRTTALSLSLLSHSVRPTVLPVLFGTRVLRTESAARAFLTQIESASTLTPVGELVAALWLTDTGAWAPGLVRRIVAACPDVEHLALGSLSRLALAPASMSVAEGEQDPGMSEGTSGYVQRPPFTKPSDSRRPLKLTLVGYTAPADVKALQEADPAMFEALTRRLRSLRLLKVRSPFHERLAGTLPGQVTPVLQVASTEGTLEEEEEGAGAGNGCIVPAFLRVCPNLESIAVPLAQLHCPMQSFGVPTGISANNESFEGELDMLTRWMAVSKTITPRLTRATLLVDPREWIAMTMARGSQSREDGRKSATEFQDLERRAREKDARVAVSSWPKNIDIVREAWLAELV